MIFIVSTALLTVVAYGLGILSLTVVTWVGNLHTYIRMYTYDNVCVGCASDAGGSVAVLPIPFSSSEC